MSDYIRERASRGNLDAYKAVLNRVPDAEPREGDGIEEANENTEKSSGLIQKVQLGWDNEQTQMNKLGPHNCNSFDEEHRIIMGHDYGAAVWIKIAVVEMAERITIENVHEVGREISIEECFFRKMFQPLFEKYFDPEMPENKHRFTRAFSNEGRYLTGFEPGDLEYNFYSIDTVERIIAELSCYDKKDDSGKWGVILAENLEQIIYEAPKGSLVYVMS